MVWQKVFVSGLRMIAADNRPLFPVSRLLVTYLGSMSALAIYAFNDDLSGARVIRHGVS
jgi:hypothetical protein